MTTNTEENGCYCKGNLPEANYVHTLNSCYLYPQETENTINIKNWVEEILKIAEKAEWYQSNAKVIPTSVVIGVISQLLEEKEKEVKEKYEQLGIIKADEKFESAMILMLTRFLQDGEEFEMEERELATAKSKWVVFSEHNPHTNNFKFKLVKNVQLSDTPTQ